MDYLYEIISLTLTILLSALIIPLTTKKLLKKFNILSEYRNEFEKKILVQDKKITEIENEININNKNSISIDDNENDNLNLEKHLIESNKKSSLLDYEHFSKRESLSELQKKRRTDELLKITSFIIAVIMSILGTIIIFTGVITSFVTSKFEWISVASGAIVDIIAGIYFWLVNRTMKEVKDNSKQLEKTEDIITSIELADKISDLKIRDETFKNMIENLMNNSK